MVYAKKLVAVVKIGGRILREFNYESISDQATESSILLPFGSEYSLMLKNLESRPARLRVWIDGEDVLDGNTIIVHPGTTTELDGFMNRGGKVTNRFKFIQKTKQIMEYRGDKIDDGLIRIECQYQKPKPVHVDIYEHHHHNHHHQDYWNFPWRWTYPVYPPYPLYPTVTWGGTHNISGASGVQVSNSMNATTLKTDQYTNTCSVDTDMFVPNHDEGITVKGSETVQQFSPGYIGPLEENSHIIIIRLKGTSKISGDTITAPVTVKTKTRCTTCGTMVESGNKYCPNCGTCVIEV